MSPNGLEEFLDLDYVRLLSEGEAVWVTESAPDGPE